MKNNTSLKLTETIGNGKFWHMDEAKIKELWENFPSCEREVIAVLELDNVDIEWQIESNEKGKELNYFVCLKSDNIWDSDDYADEQYNQPEICKSWTEVEQYMFKALSAYCNKKQIKF